MSALARVSRLAVVAAAATMLTQVCMAQTPMVGQNDQAWSAWTKAMEAINKDDYKQADEVLAQVAQKNLSPLRLALMADRTGTFQMAQALADNKLGDNAKAVMTQIEQGRTQRARAEDGWHYAAIGQFGFAKSNFVSLIKSDPDPVAVLELAGYNPHRETILLQLMDREDIGPAVADMLKLLKEGRFRLRTDPQQIVANIKKLGGNARERVTAITQLKQSGEWAAPFMIDVLLDPAQQNLHIHVLNALAEIGKPAVTPLAVSLAMDNNAVKVFVVRALGKIGYPHAVPYLKQLIENKDTPEQVRTEAVSAIAQIEQTSGKKSAASAAEGFLALGDAYYYDHGSLMNEPDAPVVNISVLARGQALQHASPAKDLQRADGHAQQRVGPAP